MIRDIRKKPSLITIFLLSCLLSMNSVVYADDNTHINSLDKQKYTNFELDVVDFQNMNSNVDSCSTERIIYKLDKTGDNIKLEFEDYVRISTTSVICIGVASIIFLIIKYIKDNKND